MISLILLMLALPALGAPPKPRPYTGSGLLIIRSDPSSETGITGSLTIYREPGVGRIAEPGYGEIPLLTRIVEPAAGEYPVAVMGKKGEWLKIAYDGAGREGWLEMARRWEIIPWEEFLPGRTARFLPWLKKGFYLLRREPSAAAPELATLPPESTTRIGRVEGDWLYVTVAPGRTGWLRWRDDEGRFLITVRP